MTYFKRIAAFLLCALLLAAAAAETQTADEEWLLMLVNATHPIPEDYVVGDLVTLRNNRKVDRRIYPDLQKMFDDARAQGLSLIVASGYRSHEKQIQLLMDKYNEYRKAGRGEEEARQLALRWVAMPGTSEHEVGFGVDINATGKTNKETLYAWLKENAWKYGFILRYPEDKVQITGIINEPWHYRYVGHQAAKEITEMGLCLEEYVDLREVAELFQQDAEPQEAQQSPEVQPEPEPVLP